MMLVTALSMLVIVAISANAQDACGCPTVQTVPTRGQIVFAVIGGEFRIIYFFASQSL